MCGIVGKLNFDRHQPVAPDLLHRMMTLIEHRGPDGGGTYCSGPIALGHRRLSIIDLATGAQPMSNEDGTVWVVYNGEIYNFQALRRQLEQRGHRFRSATDTEVIVHLYEEMGERCVSELQGMFAFALWDERRQRLLLARDRVGIKPLYYANTGHALIFASELKAIAADSSVDRRVNPGAIDRFLTCYYVPGADTLFRGVSKLAPGHILSLQHGRMTIEQYWDLDFAPQPARMRWRDAVETLRAHLDRSVKDHLISDVPVGVLLSGGVDSSGVLAHAVRHSAAPLHTFTMGFAGKRFDDERPYARLAAAKFGTLHHEVCLTARMFQDFLPAYVWYMEEPVCEPPALALHCLAQAAREHSVKVLLSGEGGDEAFGGYQTYRNILALEAAKSMFGSHTALLRAAARVAGFAVRRLVPYLDLLDQDHATYYLSRTATPPTPLSKLKGTLYQPHFARAVGNGDAAAGMQGFLERLPVGHVLDRMLYVDAKTWLPDDLLVKADKMTMAASVELRVPLLDTVILEFAAGLPRQFKVRGTQLKRVLKAALAGSVPPPILRRRKTGFPVPYDEWLRRDLRAFCHDTLLDPRARIYGYLERNAVRDLVAAQQGGAGGSKEVFCLLVLELWHRQFDGPQAAGNTCAREVPERDIRERGTRLRREAKA